MENVFASLVSYGENWQKVNERSFTEEECNAVRKATIQESKYGNSVCFFMKSGGCTYIPMSNQGVQHPVGTDVNIKDAKLVTLHRSGDGDILRVEF